MKMKDQYIDDALRAGTWKQCLLCGRPIPTWEWMRKILKGPAVANLMRNSVYIRESGSCNECEDSTCKEMPKQEGA